MKWLTGIILAGIGALFAGLAAAGGNPDDMPGVAAGNPLNATYLIDGNPIRLTGGRAEAPAAPGSATTVTTRVFGEPVYGDMDGDGEADTAVILVHDPGGSGTFYYAAAAISAAGRFHGTPATLIGDRIVVRSAHIAKRTLSVNILDRPGGAPMSATPTVDLTLEFSLKEGRLAPVRNFVEKGSAVEGRVVIGHEVRSFEPCNGQEILWLMGDSPALADVTAAYRRATPHAAPYTPVLMVLSGRRSEPPRDGFGADYEGAFLANALVGILTASECR